MTRRIAFVFVLLASPVAHAALDYSQASANSMVALGGSGQTKSTGLSSAPVALTDSIVSGYATSSAVGLQGPFIPVAQADARAGWAGGDLQIAAHAAVTTPCPNPRPPGCSAAGTLQASASAQAAIVSSDLVISGNGGPFQTQMNLTISGLTRFLTNLIEGTTLAYYENDTASDAHVKLLYQLNQRQPTVNSDNPNGPLIDATHTLAFGELDLAIGYHGATLGYSGFDPTSVPAAWNNGQWTSGNFTVATPVFTAYANKPASLYFSAQIDTGTQYSHAGQDTIASALDFSSTFGIAESGPILTNLPQGFDFSSANFNVAGNAVQAVPVPPSFILLPAALGLLRARRRNAHIPN
ncbi:MAG: hypothetical protein HY749_18190 [Gammaproteobacteria bacterium]|nr:hypothetical protein [Gammaproteobacteria bacterium]MBI5614775.1 hypothetical protein [Gammaproteobacteria bacterium]